MGAEGLLALGLAEETLRDGEREIRMDLPTLLRYSEAEVQRMLEQDREVSATVAEDARVLVQRAEGGGYVADLRVGGNTVAFVRADDFDRFRQRLKEQIAIHISRDQLPDLTEP